jgi:hypothetical protein
MSRPFAIFEWQRQITEAAVMLLSGGESAMPFSDHQRR